MEQWLAIDQNISLEEFTQKAEAACGLKQGLNDSIAETDPVQARQAKPFEGLASQIICATATDLLESWRRPQFRGAHAHKHIF